MKISTFTGNLKFSFLSGWKNQIIFVQKAGSSNSIKIFHRGKKKALAPFCLFQAPFCSYGNLENHSEKRSGRKKELHFLGNLDTFFFPVLSEHTGDIFLMRVFKRLRLSEVSLVCPRTTVSDFSFQICSGYRVIFFT